MPKCDFMLRHGFAPVNLLYILRIQVVAQGFFVKILYCNPKATKKSKEKKKNENSFKNVISGPPKCHFRKVKE